MNCKNERVLFLNYKKLTIIAIFIFTICFISTGTVYAESSLNKVKSYFSGKKRGTMTGVIALAGDGKIYFKSEDNKLYRLRGKQSSNFSDKKGDTVEITGYVKKNNLEVRKYDIIKTYVPEPVPEPIPEPVEEVTTEISGLNEDLELETNNNELTKDSETYTVVSGDTLGKISYKFYQTTKHWKDIAAENNIKNPKRLKIGQELIIPRR